MTKYRKKPVVIEAVQLDWSTWSQVCDLIGEFPEGMTGVYLDADGTPHEKLPNSDPDIGLVIPTLEGSMLARQGDWVIKGVQNEFYPCKDSIFRATYEPVED
jgi:hypothetical protein